MAYTLPSLDALSNLSALGFDELIDARSPAEFELDHVPGAVNLPVLDNDERAQVGTIYVQESKFAARRIGAALVARNAATHLDTYLADKPKNYRPLMYCWRGGQRSGSFALILTQVGWRADVLLGGYKAYRRLVNASLYDVPLPLRVVVLDGNTGTGKTELLALLSARGVQTLDLEGMARHRGSLFGHMPGGQPSQKSFESQLAMGVARLDPNHVVVVEGESNRIGDIRIPPSLWAAMMAAPRLRVEAPLPERASYLARTYADLSADTAALSRTLDALRPYHAADRVDGWHMLADTQAFTELAHELMAHHYDPRYGRSRSQVNPDQHFATQDLGPTGLAQLADDLAAALNAL
jgi:tRNA 2-selenouridine synthase